MNLVRTRSLKRLSTVVGLSLLLAAQSAVAGKIDNLNNASPLGACGASNAADTVACVGAWNLNNVQVELFPSGAFDDVVSSPSYGTYTQMYDGYSFVSNVYATSTKQTLMARVLGKDWPVGEPTGIKAVNGDTGTASSGKPENCLINTAYLDTGYLNSAIPQPVICSSPFQSHKRFKVAMQPATVDGVANGNDGKPIDFVFNVIDSSPAAVLPYQVFSKINNYTGKRLAGYKIEVGVGTGTSFQSATELGINDQLFLTLGKGESTKTVGQDLFTFDGMATFSHGLFGPIEMPHFPAPGFLSDTTAYYNVIQTCTNTATSSTVACPADVTVGSVTMTPSDTIESSGALSTNYTNVMGTNPNTFGPWLPYAWAAKGIFYDDDGNPSTDAKLVAWWDGTEWRRGQADGFAPVTAAELSAWESNPLYSMDTIEDLVNLGINYIVHVGNINATSAPIGTSAYGGTDTFTIRIIPIVSTDQTTPAWVGTTPNWKLTTPPTTTSSSGGGCTIGGDGRFDPTLPALLLAALGFVGWRRFSRKS